MYKSKEASAIDVMLTLLSEVGTLGNTLIIIDDAHNMDHLSKELLRRAIESDFFYAEESHSEDEETVVLNTGLRVRFVLTFLPSLLSKRRPFERDFEPLRKNRMKTKATQDDVVVYILYWSL